MLPVIVGSLPGGPPYFRSTASQVASQRLPWLVAIWMRHHGLHGAASCSVLLRMPIKRRHWQKRADEDDTHRRAVEPLKQNTHRSTTWASTSSFCLARWPHPSAKSVCLPNCTAQPIQPANPASQLDNRLLYAGRSSRGPPSIHPPRPRVRRFVSSALFQSLCHWAALAAWPLANTASGTYRVGLAADQAGQELLHTELLSCVSARRSQLPQKSPGLEDSVMPVMCQGQACRAAPSQRKKTEATLAPPRWGRLAG